MARYLDNSDLQFLKGIRRKAQMDNRMEAYNTAYAPCSFGFAFLARWPFTMLPIYWIMATLWS